MINNNEGLAKLSGNIDSETGNLIESNSDDIPVDKTSPENSIQLEAEQQKRKEGWLVDDNKNLADSILRVAKMSAGGSLDFSYFQEGEQAVTEFEQRAGAKRQLPDLILMDYRLDEQVQNPKFKTGVEVITELKRLAEQYQVTLPEIIAFSSEQSYTEKLMNTGASSTLKKGDARAMMEFINNFKQ